MIIFLNKCSNLIGLLNGVSNAQVALFMENVHFSFLGPLFFEKVHVSLISHYHTPDVLGTLFFMQVQQLIRQEK